MSQENRDLTLQAVAAFNRRNLDAFLALAPRTPSTSRLRARHIADTMDCAGGGKTSWVAVKTSSRRCRVHDSGDAVLITVRLSGHGPSSRVPFAQTVWMLTKWRGGKSFHWSSYLREAEALQAVGLRE